MIQFDDFYERVYQRSIGKTILPSKEFIKTHMSDPDILNLLDEIHHNPFEFAPCLEKLKKNDSDEISNIIVCSNLIYINLPM